MTLTIVPYTADWEDAVKSFNMRLQPQNSQVFFQFPESHIPLYLPPVGGRHIYMEIYLAIEDSQTVRGGYILKFQDFWIRGQRTRVGYIGLPLSEGLVDARYKFVGVQLVRDALRRESRLYGLGMGGVDRPFPRLLKGSGWKLFEVPFFFRVSRPYRFFRKIPRLRTKAVTRLASDLLACSGVGWAGLRLLQFRASRDKPASRGFQIEVVEEFGDWVDGVWELARDEYLLTAVRDQETVKATFDRRFFKNLHILKMSKSDRTVGWAVVGDSAMKNHRHFGDLRVGSLIDGFAEPHAVPHLIRKAVEYLEDQGVDLVVSNQTHEVWVEGLKRAGFMSGPSNFAMALSKDLTAAAKPCEDEFHGFHVNRGDGDGPINL